MDVNDNLHDLLGEPQYIPIDKCVIGKTHANVKKHTQVKEEDPLVISIRDMGGLIHPIIVKKIENGYDIVIGYRRVNAYRILKNEDSKYEKIRAHVIKRDLTELEIKVFSLNEGMEQNQMSRKDYVGVIDYYYKRYGRTLSTTAKALGISIATVKKYLTEARLSDRVVELIDAKEFTIDTAIQALKALDEDEESVDEDTLIKVARELQKLPPSKRKDVVKKLKGENPHRKMHKIQIHMTSEMFEKLRQQMEKNAFENVGDIIIELIDERLAELEDDKS